MSDFITEKRRNPSLNPRVSPLEQLSQHYGDPDVFVSFTSGFGQSVKGSKVQTKIGINPKSPYYTPLGIYTYPLDYVVDYSKRYHEISAPFTGSGEWEFLYVVRRKTPNIVETDDQAQEPYRRLVELINADSRVDFTIIAADIDEQFFSTPRKKLWATARQYAKYISKDRKSAAVAWNAIMRKIGVDNFVDRNNEGLIHSSEPTQAVFFASNTFQVLDIVTRVPRSPIDINRVIEQIKNDQFDYSKFNPSWSAYMHRLTPTVLEKILKNCSIFTRLMFRDSALQEIQKSYENLRLLIDCAPLDLNANYITSVVESFMHHGRFNDIGALGLDNKQFRYVMSMVFRSFDASHYMAQVSDWDFSTLKNPKEKIAILFQEMRFSVPTKRSLNVFRLCRAMQEQGIEPDDKLRSLIFSISPEASEQLFPIEKKTYRHYRSLLDNGVYDEIVPYEMARIYYSSDNSKRPSREFVEEAMDRNDHVVIYSILKHFPAAIRFLSNDDLLKLNPSKLLRLNPNILIQMDQTNLYDYLREPSGKSDVRYLLLTALRDRDVGMINKVMSQYADQELFNQYVSKYGVEFLRIYKYPTYIEMINKMPFALVEKLLNDGFVPNTIDIDHLKQYYDKHPENITYFRPDGENPAHEKLVQYLRDRHPDRPITYRWNLT